MLSNAKTIKYSLNFVREKDTYPVISITKPIVGLYILFIKNDSLLQNPLEIGMFHTVDSLNEETPRNGGVSNQEFQAV